MYSRRCIVALAFAASLALGACGALPRPFAPDTRSPAVTDPLRPVDASGVLVVAPSGEAGPAVARAVAKALRDRDVPASTTGGNRGSLRLVGALSGDGDGRVLSWALSDAAGKSLGGFRQRAVGGALATSERRGQLADAAAGNVLALLAGETTAARAPHGPALTVAAVSGAPGDGDMALHIAMSRALARAGAPPVRELGENTLVVLGSVTVSDAGAGNQRVEVLWEVLEPDGRRLGAITQRNTVPEGALDGRWGPLAATVAAGGAQGVIELLERTGYR